MTDHTELRRLAEAATNVTWRPGHLCRDDHGCGCKYIFADNDSMGAIASVHVDDGENGCPPLEEAKANQRFIAAASPSVVLSLIAEVDRLMEALVHIAAYHDAAASEALATNGSYSSFDEPGSVEIARTALGDANG